MVLLEFSIAPVGQGESVSAHVARILDLIDRSGVPYQLTPMGTILEGEWAEVMAVVTALLRDAGGRLPACRPAPEGGLPRRPGRAAAVQDRPRSSRRWGESSRPESCFAQPVAPGSTPTTRQ